MDLVFNCSKNRVLNTKELSNIYNTALNELDEGHFTKFVYNSAMDLKIFRNSIGLLGQGMGCVNGSLNVYVKTTVTSILFTID